MGFNSGFKGLIRFFLSAERRRFVSQEAHKIRNLTYFSGDFLDGQREDYELEGSERAPN